MIEILPVSRARVFDGSNTLPIPKCSVPEMMVMCSIPGCQCGGTLKIGGKLQPEHHRHRLIQHPLDDSDFHPGERGKVIPGEFRRVEHNMLACMLRGRLGAAQRAYCARQSEGCGYRFHFVALHCD